MKKIISGMLIFASLAGGMSAFTSCKDTDDDQYAVLQREDFRLMQQIQDLKDALEAAKAQYTVDLNKAIGDLRTEIANGYVTKATFDALEQRVAALEGKVCACGDLQQKLNTLEANIHTWVEQKGYLTSADLNGYVKDSELTDYLKKDGLDQAILALLGDETSATYKKLVELGLGKGGESYDDTQVKNEIEALRKALEALGYTVSQPNPDGTVTITPPAWAADNGKIADAIQQAGWVSTNKTSLENIINNFKDIDPSTLLTKTDAADTYLTKEDFEEYKNSLKNDLDEFVRIYNEVAGPLDMKADFQNLNELLTDYASWRKEISAKVAANESAIAELQKKYNVIAERLDAMITSIVAEGTWNPVFGTFAAPAGVASNVLMAYYGDMNYVEFPNDGSQYEFDGEQIITTADMQMLGVTPKSYSGVVLQGDQDNYVGNAGTLYMTVNPGNADMTGKTFTLVNSQNKASGVTVGTPVKSDQVLTFGYTYGRATKDVSLYEAAATLTPENVHLCRIDIEPGLKTAAKEFYNDRSASSLAGLMKAVYDQLNGILPRLAVKAEWNYNTTKWDETTATWVDSSEPETGVVRSGLDIAATTFKPLSYKTLEGKKINRKLPILSEVSIDWDKLLPELKEIKIDPVDLSGITIDFKLADVNFNDINKDLTVKVSGKVNIEGKEYDITLEGKVVPENLQNFIDQMADAFREQVKESNDRINTEFKRVMKELQDKINAMILSVNDQINDTFNDIMSQIKNNIEGETGKYFDKVNSLINKYNKVANRINKILDNPNHYMQVTMLFKNSEGGYSLLSTNETAPSKFTISGAGALMLFPTTYNAEIVSPAFKKFVGICDVVNLATGKSAQQGDAAAKAALDKANKGVMFDEVIDGRNLRVGTGDLTAGFKYVVAYSALDYRGFTSTNKYYFQVN